MSISGCLEFSNTYELRVGGTLASTCNIVSYSNYYMEQGDDGDNC